MATMKNNYSGEIKMQDGKKIKFTIHGTTVMEARKLLREANPKAIIRLAKKNK